MDIATISKFDLLTFGLNVDSDGMTRTSQIIVVFQTYPVITEIYQVCNIMIWYRMSMDELTDQC